MPLPVPLPLLVGMQRLIRRRGWQLGGGAGRSVDVGWVSETIATSQRN